MNILRQRSLKAYQRTCLVCCQQISCPAEQFLACLETCLTHWQRSSRTNWRLMIVIRDVIQKRVVSSNSYHGLNQQMCLAHILFDSLRLLDHAINGGLNSIVIINHFREHVLDLLSALLNGFKSADNIVYLTLSTTRGRGGVMIYISLIAFIS